MPWPSAGGSQFEGCRSDLTISGSRYAVTVGRLHAQDRPAAIERVGIAEEAHHRVGCRRHGRSEVCVDESAVREQVDVLSPGEAGVEVDDRDVVGPKRRSECVRQSVERGFGRRTYPSSVPNRIGPSAEGSLGACKSPCAEVMLMITPPPRLAQMRYDETREDERRVHVDVELVTPRVERVLVDGRGELPWVSAALFTSPSTAPKCATVRSTSNRRSSGSETSHATANACPPSLSTTATVSPTEPISRCRGSTVRAATTTFMPCRASVSATSRPMPRLAPVTMATRSRSSTSDARRITAAGVRLTRGGPSTSVAGA